MAPEFGLYPATVRLDDLDPKFEERLVVSILAIIARPDMTHPSLRIFQDFCSSSNSAIIVFLNTLFQNEILHEYIMSAEVRSDRSGWLSKVGIAIKSG